MNNLPDKVKLVKVTYHYSDDSEYFIENKFLKMWNEFNLQVASFCQLHRINPDWTLIKWTKKENI